MLIVKVTACHSGGEAASSLSGPDQRIINTGRRAPVQRSRVGQKLSDLTTSRVVVLVLSMLFILPIYNIGGGIYGSYPGLGLDGLDVRHPDSMRSRVKSRNSFTFSETSQGRPPFYRIGNSRNEAVVYGLGIYCVRV